MSEYLNERYKDLVDFFLCAVQGYSGYYGWNIDIVILPEDNLNAAVKKVDDAHYVIYLWSRCLNLMGGIKNLIGRYTSDDLFYFARIKHLGIFERLEDDTYLDELSNLIATTILLHILFHECGHIEAKHLRQSEMNMEYDSKMEGGYISQEKEMVADWLSSKFVLKSMYRSIVQDETRISSKEMLMILKKIIVLYWLSLCIEFQLFDFSHGDESDFMDYSLLDHPHPSVRLYYNFEAVVESVSDILVELGLPVAEADSFAMDIIKDSYLHIQSFIQITSVPIYYKSFTAKTIRNYIKLREITYEAPIVDNYLHLEPMSNELREQLEAGIKVLGEE